jgi:energy-coupling factor transporter ATP-binding protein EcfA2
LEGDAIMSKGSTWNRWDFHLHTPYSILNNQFGSPENDSTWEKYVATIEKEAKEKEIVAIGVTDYFIIEGYKKLKSIQDSGKLQNILLFPNIEFRLDKCIYKSKPGSDPKRINTHVLFSPDVKPNNIEEDFLQNIEFTLENEPYDKSKTRKLTIKNLTEFGQKLQHQHEKFKTEVPFYTGCMNAVVRIEDLKDLLESHFRGNYLIVLADENIGDISWDGQDHAIRKQLIQISHAIFSSSDKSRDFYLGKYHNTKQEFIEEFKSLKPCIWGCDAHCYDEQFLSPDLERFCWIKSEISWEGVKQILYEPEDRVRIQKENPEPNKSIYTISRYKNNDTQINSSLRISSNDIELNHNLITIIGGRGSGKTALLDLIASCFHEGEKLQDLDKSFYYRIFRTPDKKQKTNQPIPVELHFRSSEIFKKEVGKDQNYFDSADILYLTQDHFEEYTKNPEKLYDHINILVFEKYQSEKQVFEEKKQTISALSKEIQKNNLDYQQIQDDIKGKKQQLQIDVQAKKGDKADNLQRIADNEKSSGGSSDVIREATDALISFRKKKQAVIDLIANLGNLAQFLSKVTGGYSVFIESINPVIESFNDENLTKLPLMISGISDVEIIIETDKVNLTKILTSIDDQIVKSEKSITDFEGIDKLIAELRQKSQDIDSVINSLENQIVEITTKEEELIHLEESSERKYLEIITLTEEEKWFLQQIIEKFEKDKDIQLNNITFSSIIVSRKKEDVLSTLLEKVNKLNNPENEIRSTLNQYFDRIYEYFSDKSIQDQLPQIISDINRYSKTLTTKKGVQESEITNAIFTPFFDVGFQIEFNKKELYNLSMGERAIVLLKILLSLDDKPLLIDQPEEHLDNRYIFDDLVPAFRAAKQKRQIIIATHNANLVVNTDSEQVIIAENDDGSLEYRVGSLENTELREDITKILEGGEEAFKKREEKYGMRF